MIDAKQSFLSQVRKRAAEELTAADMDRLTAILSDVLEGFRVEELIANLLGHENLDTTMRYVVLNKEETKHNYRRYA